ncbi:MAG: hypothetical protein AAGH88_15390 [Planctomycetota bacterium]
MQTRHKYLIQGGTGLAILGFFGWSVVETAMSEPEPNHAATPSSKQVTPPEPATPELDHNVYARATTVRRNAALGNFDLAALGLTQEQAEAVLERLTDWCVLNAGRLATAESAVRGAEREVRGLERRVRTGLATPQEMASLSRKRRGLSTTRVQLLDLQAEGGAFAMQTQPSAGVRWNQARQHGVAVRGELRYLPSLTAQRFRTLRATSARNNTGLEDALMFHEKQELQQIRLRVQAHLPGVVAASQAVLPDPTAEGLLLDGPAE